MIRCCWVQVAAHTPLLHDATSIAAKNTIAQVQTRLSSDGATAVMVAYDRGDPVTMQFKTVVDDEGLGDRMPIGWRAVLQVMRQDRVA